MHKKIFTWCWRAESDKILFFVGFLNAIIFQIRIRFLSSVAYWIFYQHHSSVLWKDKIGFMLLTIFKGIIVSLKFY